MKSPPRRTRRAAPARARPDVDGGHWPLSHIHVLRGTGTSMCIGREQAVVAQEMASRAGDEGGESGDEVQGLKQAAPGILPPAAFVHLTSRDGGNAENCRSNSCLAQHTCVVPSRKARFSS